MSWTTSCGKVTPGEPIRLLDAWIFAGSDRAVTDVWAAGRHVVREGRHVARAPVEAGYRRVMRELRDRL